MAGKKKQNPAVVQESESADLHFPSNPDPALYLGPCGGGEAEEERQRGRRGGQMERQKERLTR